MAEFYQKSCAIHTEISLRKIMIVYISFNE